MFRGLNPVGAEPRVISEVVNGILNGKINSTGTVTLGTSATETTVYDERASSDTVILLSARTANASTENVYVYIKTKNDGNFVIGHRSSTNGKIKRVTFGDPNMKIKKNVPERRKSFRARHKCDTAKDKTKARYWSCKAW